MKSLKTRFQKKQLGWLGHTQDDRRESTELIKHQD